MTFTAALDALDAAVADNLSDDVAAVLTPAAGGDPLTVRAILERPEEPVQLRGSSDVVLAQPTVQVPFADAPVFRRGDVVTINGVAWRAEDKPHRPGDGRWWLAQVQPVVG